MCFRVSTSSKASITNGTLEWLLPLMIHTLLRSKVIITNGTLMFFLPLRNYPDIIFQILPPGKTCHTIRAFVFFLSLPEPWNLHIPVCVFLWSWTLRASVKPLPVWFLYELLQHVLSSFQITISSKNSIANITLECLFPLCIYCCNMCLQASTFEQI